MSRNDRDSGSNCDRTGKRDSLFLLTTLYDDNGDVIGMARIRNLSASGMMAESQASLIAGMRVRCDIRGVGEIRGEVVRVEGHQLGVRFDSRIDPLNARRPVSGKPVRTKQKPDFSSSR